MGRGCKDVAVDDGSRPKVQVRHDLDLRNKTTPDKRAARTIRTMRSNSVDAFCLSFWCAVRYAL